jgi:hypothetical protein
MFRCRAGLILHVQDAVPGVSFGRLQLFQDCNQGRPIRAHPANFLAPVGLPKPKWPVRPEDMTRRGNGI